MPRKKKQVKTEVKPSESPVLVTREQDSQANAFLFLSMFLKATGLALLIVIIPLLMVACVFAFSYTRILSEHAGMPIGSLISLVRSGWARNVEQTDGKKNILILGVDSLSVRENEAVNTDTIMVASLNLEQGKITTFSIPRDLFLTDSRQKINGIYATALKNGEQKPEVATELAVEKLTAVPIHHVVVLEIEAVGKLIDALGGLDVTIERSFTDEEYPNEAVDPRVEKDPRALYKTISFTAGEEHMDGRRALEYIRSRHSKDPVEGSDDARARRQQQVMEALTNKLSDASIIKNPAYLGDLIKLYRQDFDRYLPFEEAVAVGKVFISQRKFPVINGLQFAVQGFDADPVLYHPERFYTRQWVYLLIDPSGKKFQETIAGWLK